MYIYVCIDNIFVQFEPTADCCLYMWGCCLYMYIYIYKQQSAVGSN